MAYIIEDTEGNFQTYETAVSMKEEDGKYVIYGSKNKILAIYPKFEVKKVSSTEETD